MSRWSTVAALLVAASLPYGAAAKPPDLPVQTKDECQEQAPPRPRRSLTIGFGVNAQGQWLFSAEIKKLDESKPTDFTGPNPAGELLDHLCPGWMDMLENCWRTLHKWVPATRAGCCATKPASRLEVIEVLPMLPTLEESFIPVEEKLQRLCPHMRIVPLETVPMPGRRAREKLNTSDDLRKIESEWERIFFPEQPSHLTPQRVHGKVGCWTAPEDMFPLDSDLKPIVVPLRLRELIDSEALRLIEQNWERILFADEPIQVTPRPQTNADCTACPHLRRPVGQPSASVGASCFLENLRAMEQAHELYRKAERYRRNGRTELARRCYQDALDCCPGSACAAQAAGRLWEMLIQLPVVEKDTADAEEQEAPPAAKKETRSPKWEIEIELNIRVKPKQ